MGVRIYEAEYKPFSLEGYTSEEVERVVADYIVEPLGTLGDAVVFYIDAEYIEDILANRHLPENDRKVLEALKHEAEKRDGGFDLVFL